MFVGDEDASHYHVVAAGTRRPATCQVSSSSQSAIGMNRPRTRCLASSSTTGPAVPIGLQAVTGEVTGRRDSRPQRDVPYQAASSSRRTGGWRAAGPAIASPHRVPTWPAGTVRRRPCARRHRASARAALDGQEPLILYLGPWRPVRGRTARRRSDDRRSAPGRQPDLDLIGGLGDHGCQLSGGSHDLRTLDSDSHAGAGMKSSHRSLCIVEASPGARASVA